MPDLLAPLPPGAEARIPGVVIYPFVHTFAAPTMICAANSPSAVVESTTSGRERGRIVLARIVVQSTSRKEVSARTRCSAGRSRRSRPGPRN